MKERNDNMIYIWRIIFANMIAFFHFDGVYNITENWGLINGWYIAVEFFFIVSGFLLYQQCKDGRYTSNVAYIKDKIFKIYPTYLICFIIAFMFKTANDPAGRMGVLYDSFWELVCLQSIGLDRGWNYVSSTTWYISALFICSFFLFFLLKNYEKITVDFLIPLSIIIFYSWFYRNGAMLDVVIDIDGFYRNGALMRGIAGMGLGVIAARLNGYLVENAKNKMLWKGFSIIGFLSVILHSLKNGYSSNDFPMAFILCICIAIGFLPNERVKIPGIIKYWSKATLGLYLIHGAVRKYIFPQYFGYPESIHERIELCVFYLLFVNVAGVILMLLSTMIQKTIVKMKSIFLK